MLPRHRVDALCCRWRCVIIFHWVVDFLIFWGRGYVLFDLLSLQTIFRFLPWPYQVFLNEQYFFGINYFWYGGCRKWIKGCLVPWTNCSCSFKKLLIRLNKIKQTVTAFVLSTDWFRCRSLGPFHDLVRDSLAVAIISSETFSKSNLYVQTMKT